MWKIGHLVKVAIGALVIVLLYGGTAAAYWGGGWGGQGGSGSGSGGGGGGGGWHQASAPGVFGTVESVGGVSTSGTCGTALASDATGTFVLTGYQSSTTWTVDVSSTTDVVDPGVSSATFANVCVGERAGAIGTIDTSTDTVAATTVYVAQVVTPPTPQGVFGTVTAVGSVSTSGTCGTALAADATGTFTLATWRQTTAWTVTVTSSTNFEEPGVSSATFANVCVGSVVGVMGSVDTSASTVSATRVVITPPPSGVVGTVASVGGVSTSGTCGTALTSGQTGTFTLTTYHGSTTWTVDVSSTTTFVAPGVSEPTFANVCVGEVVGAMGSVDVGTDTVAATQVFVAPVRVPPTTQGVFGTVTAVGGVSTSGTCGTALTSDATGTFTLTTWKQTSTWTVTVNASTTFSELGSSSASFAEVCVGSVVGVLGTTDTSNNTVTATKVVVAPSTSWTRGGYSGRTGRSSRNRRG